MDTYPIDGVAYTCQPALAYRLDRDHYGRKHWLYFSKELNPMVNGDSANPLWIYMTADRAVKSGDVNHPKLRKWRDGLKRGVDYRHGKGEISPPMSDREVAQLKADIESAPIAWLRPQVWKLSVSPSDLVQPPNAFPDEYHQEDFADGKVALIVE